MVSVRVVLHALFVSVVAALALPALASAAKLVYVEGKAPIAAHTELHFQSHVKIAGFGSGFECEANGIVTTEDGTNATTKLSKLSVITNTCTGFGFFEGCKISNDAALAFENMTIDSNTLTTDLSLAANMTEGTCPVEALVVDFKSVSILVGAGPITVGIFEGNGVLKDEFGELDVALSGEATIGQYTEEKINKGSAKGVFEIE